MNISSLYPWDGCANRFPIKTSFTLGFQGEEQKSYAAKKSKLYIESSSESEPELNGSSSQFIELESLE